MILRKLLYLLLCLVLLSISATTQPNVKASPDTIRVPQDYTTIQEAINQASPGDTIQVSAGTYREHLYINKTLTLKGENRENTVIDGTAAGYVIKSESTTVDISGFTIINGSNGILLENCNGSILKQNIVNGFPQRGIWLHYSNSNIISDNIVSDNLWRGIVLCGHSSKNTVTCNTIKDNGNGLCMTGEDNILYHNNFINNQNQTRMLSSFKNAWDNSYEGNYWSDHNRSEFDRYGICDTPYVIDARNQDNYPLKSPYILGDVNHDAKVNIIDISTIAIAFGTQLGEEKWNPHADIDENSKIDILDISTAAKNFGKEWKHP